MPEEISFDNPFAIIGESDTISGFRALGFKVYAVKEHDDCVAALDDVVRNKIVICLVQDNFYGLAEQEITSYKALASSTFIPFSKEDRTDSLDSMVRNIRLRATGAF